MTKGRVIEAEVVQMEAIKRNKAQVLLVTSKDLKEALVLLIIITKEKTVIQRKIHLWSWEAAKKEAALLKWLYQETIHLVYIPHRKNN